MEQWCIVIGFTCNSLSLLDELSKLFEDQGLVKEQLMTDSRLQVNRGRQLKMYRVWIQAKYCKPC